MKQKTKKIAAYTVSGVTFLGAVTGLLVNMTRLGDNLSAETPGIVQVMPTLIQEPPPVSEYIDSELQHSVTYAVEQTDTHLKINYSTSAIDAPFKSVGELGEGPFFSLPKVGIDVKLVNNTDEAIFVTDAVIQVKESRVNLDPLLVSVQHDGIVGYLTWLNDGWGEPETLSVSAKVAGTTNSTIDLPYELARDELVGASVYNFDITPLLSEFGIESNAYRAARAYDEDDETALEIWRDINTICIRKFGNLNDVAEFLEMISGEPVDPAKMTNEQIGSTSLSCSIELEGVLSTTWTKNGSLQTREQPFSVLVMVTPPEGLGSVGFQPTGAYDVKLRSEGSHYTINVPISQPVSPAGFDRFILWMGAEKSSAHDMVVTLTYNQDKEISTSSIQVNYLRPKSTASGSLSAP